MLFVIMVSILRHGMRPLAVKWNRIVATHLSQEPRE